MFWSNKIENLIVNQNIFYGNIQDLSYDLHVFLLNKLKPFFKIIFSMRTYNFAIVKKLGWVHAHFLIHL